MPARSSNPDTAIRRPLSLAILGGVICVLPTPTLLGGEDSDSQRSLRTPYVRTLQDRLFWGDVFHRAGWRIQHNAVDDSYRLLSPQRKTQVAGDWRSCRNELARLERLLKLPPDNGRVVVLIHGIVRNSTCFSKLHESLAADGKQVVDFDYPSTRVTIPESAEYLARTIQSLEKATQIDLVVHSMGGLVTRQYLKTYGHKRIGRIVMLGVPNLGARMADRMRKVPVYRMIFGPAGEQLVSDPDGLIASLPIPEVDFAVIAGGRGNDKGFNPLIPGDDDGTVSVASARLPGAADFCRVRCLHSFLMFDQDVIEMTIRFLDTGRLQADRPPAPIPPEPPSVEDR